MSDSLYERKPGILILVGVTLLLMFDQRFEFSGLLFILTGTFIAHLRLSYRQAQIANRKPSVVPVKQDIRRTAPTRRMSTPRPYFRQQS